MISVNIINNVEDISQAFGRYFKFVLGMEVVEISFLDNPYGQKEAFGKAQKSDFLVLDGFVGEKPKGFQFSKAMEKRVLLLFYAGEIEIEYEGPFWLVLPYGLERLGDKIKELMEKPVPDVEEFENLEKRFPELSERKEHHG
jgi:hypothetical protein